MYTAATKQIFSMSINNRHILCNNCFDTVGWASGRASDT